MRTRRIKRCRRSSPAGEILFDTIPVNYGGGFSGLDLSTWAGPGARVDNINGNSVLVVDDIFPQLDFSSHNFTCGNYANVRFCFVSLSTGEVSSGYVTVILTGSGDVEIKTTQDVSISTWLKTKRGNDHIHEFNLIAIFPYILLSVETDTIGNGTVSPLFDPYSPSFGLPDCSGTVTISITNCNTPEYYISAEFQGNEEGTSYGSSLNVGCSFSGNKFESLTGWCDAAGYIGSFNNTTVHFDENCQ